MRASTFTLLVLASASMVFLLIGETCGQSPVVCKGIKITRVGCFKDGRNPRPLPNLLFTDRDKSSKVYSGVPLNWAKWDDYMRGFICRCATKSLSLNQNLLGLQYYGECWSGPNKVTLPNYKKDGVSPNCITWNFKPCTNNKDCVGKQNTNFIYTVKRDQSSPTAGSSTRETTRRTPTPTPTPTATPSPTPSPTPPTTPSPTPSPTRPVTPTGIPSPTTPPNNLECKEYVVSLNIPQSRAGLGLRCDICNRVKIIYHGYPCFYDVKFLNTARLPSSNQTVANLLVQFTCTGRHLKRLIMASGNRGISAKCYYQPCQPLMGVPVGVSPCQQTPSTCTPACQSAMVSYTGSYSPLHPVQPMSQVSTDVCGQAGCPASCAPACNSFCCRSSVIKSSTDEDNNNDDDDNYDDDDNERV